MEVIAPQAGGAERFALRVMQLGAIAIVVAATPLFDFELDRFFVPKELVLHVTAVIAGLAAARRAEMTRVDVLLVGFLILSAISAALASNPQLALRAVAISASSVVIFWTARALRQAGLDRRLVNALAAGIVLISITALLQTYGVQTELFSINRAPGGTLGNRNFVAHAAAFGLPLVLLSALRAAGVMRFLLGAAGIAIITASLVLTRSRAGWLAFAAVGVIFFVAMVRGFAPWKRLVVIVIVLGGGVAAALLVPNTLRWRSDNPYLESVQRIADYEEGSGRGRLIQYERSLRMAAAYPLFGVGPGHWKLEYPDFAARRDPSINPSDGKPFNPWPSSDWVAWIAERGIAAVILLALAFAGMAFGKAQDPLVRTALLATLAASLLAGAFDAVLLIALPAFFVPAALGVLWMPAHARPRPRWVIVILLGVIGISAAGALASAEQLLRMAAR